MWEINGLPLHPLVVHAAVVFGPLAALSALAYVGLPKHRDRLRWVTLVVVADRRSLSIWAAYLTGTTSLDSGQLRRTSRGEAQEKIDTHEDYAGRCAGSPPGSPLVTVVAVWQHARTGAARYVLGAARGRRRRARPSSGPC